MYTRTHQVCAQYGFAQDSEDEEAMVRAADEAEAEAGLQRTKVHST